MKFFKKHKDAIVTSCTSFIAFLFLNVMVACFINIIIPGYGFDWLYIITLAVAYAVMFFYLLII